MKLFVIGLALASFAAAPALAAEKSPAPSRGKADPNEMICKMRATTAGIPRRVCGTRADWDKDSSRTRQELMLSQRPFCVGGSGC